MIQYSTWLLILNSLNSLQNILVHHDGRFRLQDALNNFERT